MGLASRSIGLGSAPALLVVDASRGFTDPASPLGGDFAAELTVINQLLDRAHHLGWPVVLSTVVYRHPDEATVFRAKLPDLELLQAGSKWVELDPGLHRAEGDRVLEKTHPSCFHGTDLDAWLRQVGVDSVVVTGFTTSGCVRATAVDALQYDYRTVVVADAVGDRDAAAHTANLRDLELKYTDVIDSRALAAALAARSR
ncbi:MAG: isochorismatase family protein [Gammaproteobacteria bacterium]|nr:MAG: isochorismatase family protein [Gammaproteobacteria bacterium]